MAKRFALGPLCFFLFLASAHLLPISFAGSPFAGKHSRSPGRDHARTAPSSAGTSVDALTSAQVALIAESAAQAFESTHMAVAVVDRPGNILALFRKPDATDADAELAVGLARTAAFFSNNQAPLSSRTVRFISGVHFPPGIERTANAALYGIENSNRGCDLNMPYLSGQEFPASRSVSGIVGDLPCNSIDQSGCGLGIVTGKVQPKDADAAAVNPGGVPIFRFGSPSAPGIVLGGVGVAGIPPGQAEFAAFQAAFAAGTTAPVPVFPLPAPGNVFIDGIRLPFVEHVRRPQGTSGGPLVGAYDPMFMPKDGTPAPEGYLVGPRAGSRLTVDQVDTIVRHSFRAANRTRAQIRLPLGLCTRMIIAVADTDGSILALYRMNDATIFSLDVAVTKARNVVYFSDPNVRDLDGVPAGTAVTNRTISFGAQPFFPPGIDQPAGPFFESIFVNDLDNLCSQGSQDPTVPNQSGIVFFPGSTPLYDRNDTIVGGLGISGDGVEQDDFVTFLGAKGYLPRQSVRANEVFIDGIRLPFLKFPRNPGACHH